jgi:hypothetical protein
MRINGLTSVTFIPLMCLAASCLQVKTGPEWPELSPVLKRHDLIASEPPQRRHEVADIEEADSRSYSPVAGATLFLQAASPTRDSEGLKPRYWLRVEDYATAELASQRAKEYIGLGAYERVAQAYGKVDSFMASKLTVRLWAVARGKRVYALTTDTYLFTLIELPKSLRGSILALPET